MHRRVEIYDCDGTLYDDRLAHAQFLAACERFFGERFGIAPRELWTIRDQLRTATGSENSISLLASHFHITREDATRAVFDAIDLVAAGVRKNDALRTLLLQRPAERVVWSNNPRCYVERVLGVLGIRDCIASVLAWEDLTPLEKPQPEAYAHVAARFPDARFTMIENTLANLLVPIKLGWDAVLVTWGKDRDLGDIPAGIRTIPTIEALE